MSVPVYVDTNVYLDYLLDRCNVYGRRLGPDAFEFFRRAVRCEFVILVSEAVLRELYGNIEVGRTKLLFSLIGRKIRVVDMSEADRESAKSLDPVNVADALHAVVANRHGARYLVTRNKKHFLAFSGLVEPVYPDEI